ncbi:MAG: carbamate kinase [Spirochaetes bacterium]|nr:carbamate kinase [Spirochaetota bacterium]
MNIVLAVGGNSLIIDPKKVTVGAQYEAARQTAEHIADLVKKGHKVVVVHGNGPQVGFILRRGEIAKNELHTVPLDSCVADTQGAIGYNLQMAIRNELLKQGLSKPVTTVVTQVVVDKNDPSFQKPTKPIGSFMDKEQAEFHQKNDNWDVVEDAGRGFRRVVASPEPKEILEISAIKALLGQDFTVVAVGGGGIPVLKNEDGSITGQEAVIDKDFAASLLAKEICADLFVISTAVEQVCINFGKPDQKALREITVAEAEQYIKEGHFAPGSMLPKIQAAIRYIQSSGKNALITNPENLGKALEGQTGTLIKP